MHILMPYKTGIHALRACGEILGRRGAHCVLYPYESADKLRKIVQSSSPDLLLAAESAVLPTRSAPAVPTVYLGTDFYCADARLPSYCDAYWIAQGELAFDFMTHGARDKRVQVCGVPLGEAYRRQQTRRGACRALGVAEDTPIFSVRTDGVSRYEIQATVRACRTLCPETKLLLWSTDAVRRGVLRAMFAGTDTVYVPDADDAAALSLAAGDVFFTPAFSVPVCAAARQGKSIILLHAASPRARHNAAFLDTRGIAFCGKTAADNVSYACRLLSLTRLQQNMRAAQEKYIVRDAEQRLIQLVGERMENA